MPKKSSDTEEDIKEYSDSEEEDQDDVEYTDTNATGDVEEDDEEYTNDEIIPIELKEIPKEERVTRNKLTKYEMVRILGERQKQLTMGAKPLIKNHTGLSYDVIAEEELKLNMIPFKIKRPLPNGKYEIWTLDELDKDHLLSLLD